MAFYTAIFSTLGGICLFIPWHIGLWRIFKKAGISGWYSLVPAYNMVILLEILGLPWWGVFFLYVPLFNIIPLLIIAFELGACFKKGKVWSFFLLFLFPFIGYFILGLGYHGRFQHPVDYTRIEKVYNKFLKFALYLTIVVLLNIVGMQTFFRIDLTKIGTYSLSRASKQAVATLEEPLTVRVFFSNDLPETDLSQYVEDLLSEYAVHGRQNFNYRFYDVGGEDELTPRQETNRKFANDYGIYPVKVQEFKNDALILKEVYMGMAIIHGDVIETISQIPSKARLEYEITTTIQKMNNKISALLALDDTIKIKLFLSSGFFTLLEALTDLPGQVEGIVEQLNKENYNKLKYIYFDPSLEPHRMAAEEPLNPRYYLDRDQNRLYADLIIQYADKIEKFNFLEVIRTPFGNQPQVANEETLKEVIKNTVTDIIDINEYIGYVADHDTPRFDWNDMELQAYAREHPNIDVRRVTAELFKEILTEHYSLKEIRMSEGEKIPKGIECLVIAGPKTVFSDWELFQIDQFLMQGKSLAIFLDGIEEVEPQVNRQLYGYNPPKEYPAVDTRLQYLLEHFGAGVGNSFVYDENCVESNDPKYGKISIFYIPKIQNEFINEDLQYMRNIRGLIMVKTSPITLFEERLQANGIKADILFSSSNKSWEISESISLDNPLTIIPPQDEDKQSFPLAVALEGRFSSYFHDKPIPRKPKKEVEREEFESEEVDAFVEEVTDEVEVIKKAEVPGRIFLVGTSEIVRDFLLAWDPTPQNPTDIPPNKALISNVIDYCNGKEDYAAMRSKLQLVNPLDETKVTPLIKDFTKYFNLIALPAIVILCGILILIIRNAWKKRLLMRFGQKGAAIMTEEATSNKTTIGAQRMLSTVQHQGLSKGLKFTKDYLTLVIIIGLLLGSIIWINISRSIGVIRYKLPKLTLIEKDSIDKIVFTNKNGIYTLEKENDDLWRIMPEGYPVDPAHINTMLDNLSDLTVSELISEQEQYDRYELDDDSKIHVTAYIAGTLVREVDIGKPSSTFSHTYITLKDDPNIYSVKDNLQSLFDKDTAGLRDEKVLSYPKNEITQIILEFEDQVITMNKQLKRLDEDKAATGRELWFTDIINGPVKKRAIDDILNTMGNLVCEEFYTDIQKSDLDVRPFDYRIKARGEKDYVLTIFDHPGDNKHPAYSSESEYAFKLIGWRATKMMKEVDDLKED